MRQVNKTVLYARARCAHSGRLVHGWLIALDGMHSLADEFLNQLRTRTFIFDQDCPGFERLGLLSHRSLQFWICEALAKNIEQVNLLFPYAPSGADWEFLGGLPKPTS